MLTRTLTCAVVMTTVVVAMELAVRKQFAGGFQCDFCYPVPRVLHGWTGRLVFQHPIDRLEIYSANIVEVGQGNTVFVITSKHYNADLQAGENLCLKFTARTEDTLQPRVYFDMDPEGYPPNTVTATSQTGSLNFSASDSPSLQLRSSSVLWQLRDLPSSGHSPLAAFHPQSQGQFGGDDSASVVDDPSGQQRKVLRVFYQKGHYGGTHSHRGVQFYSRPISARTDMTFSYDVFFSPGFDFVKGGKLPGLFGGATNCSGGRHSDLCFSTRLMWRRHGDGEVYAYIPEHQDSSLCLDSHNHCNPAYGNSLGRGSWRFQTGVWQTVTQRLRLNTPGHLNGRVQMWYNGQQVLDVQNLNLRTHGGLLIEGIFFSTFFGGSDNTWAPTADCYTYFRNFVLSAGEEDAVVG